MSVNNSTDDFEACYTYPNLYIRDQFYMVFGVGSSVAVISIILNSLLLYLFSTHPYFRRKIYFYLIFMALFDLLNSIFYILIFSVCIFYEYVGNAAVMRIWHMYVIPVFALAHITRCSITYLIVAVSLERYLSANWFSGFCTIRRRSVVVFAVFIWALVVRGTTFWELVTQHRPNCSELAEFIVLQSPLTEGLFGLVFCFWFRNVVTVFLPFSLLIFLNLGVVLRRHCACINVVEETTGTKAVRRLQVKFSRPTMEVPEGGLSRDQLFNKTLTQDWVRRARERVQRAATRTLACIVLTYLITSGVAFIITAWEHIDADSLYSHYHLYTIASDLVSLLSVSASATRLPIYFACDLKFRQVFCRTFCTKLHEKKVKQKLSCQQPGANNVGVRANSIAPPMGGKRDDFRNVVLQAMKSRSKSGSENNPLIAAEASARHVTYSACLNGLPAKPRQKTTFQEMMLAAAKQEKRRMALEKQKSVADEHKAVLEIVPDAIAALPREDAEMEGESSVPGPSLIEVKRRYFITRSRSESDHQVFRKSKPRSVYRQSTIDVPEF